MHRASRSEFVCIFALNWLEAIAGDNFSRSTGGQTVHGTLTSLNSTCGLIDVGRAATCNKLLSTNCTSPAQAAGLCPLSCPYVAIHPQIECSFECVAEDECSLVNPLLAFADRQAKVCKSCHIEGCQYCVSPNTCLNCFQDFFLDSKGHCVYAVEGALGPVVTVVISVLGCIIGIALLALLVLQCYVYCSSSNREILTGWGLDEDDALDYAPYERDPQLLQPSLRALQQGSVHRLRCKIKCQNDSPLTFTPEVRHKLPAMTKVPLAIDLRSRYLVGVGLPLFHGWIPFLMLYSLSLAVGTFVIYIRSPLKQVLLQAGALRMGVFANDEQGALGLCRLYSHKSDVLAPALESFAYDAAWGYLVLWIVGLALSVAHAARQKALATKFREDHVTLADFALNVEGFPPDALDEDEILATLRALFREPRLSVSVCYDFHHKRDRINNLVEKVLAQEDVRQGAVDADLILDAGLTDKDREEVMDLLNPESQNSIKNAGSVFAIFPNCHKLQKASQAFVGSEEEDSDDPDMQGKIESRSSGDLSRKDLTPMLPRSKTVAVPQASPMMWISDDGEEHPLTVRKVICEPPDVVWDQIGISATESSLRSIFGVLLIGLVAFAFARLLFVPFAAYVNSYIWSTGNFPQGITMTVFGLLGMLANWVICVLLCEKVGPNLGFHRKDREDLFIFEMFTLISFGNFLFNASMSMFPGREADLFGTLFSHLGSNDCDVEHIVYAQRTGARLFFFLFPGGLFVGYLMWPFAGFVWPYLSTLGALRCRFHGSSGSALSARRAELALEPLPLGIPNDYMGFLVQPMSCSLLLFFASSFTWQIFVVMAVWVVWMLLFFRYLHLRTNKQRIFSTSRLDTQVLYYWAVPSSMVLAASCFWAARLYKWPMYYVILAWLVGALIYVVILTLCVRPLNKGMEQASFNLSYEEARALRMYDWHNCNPIKVLASHCRAEDTGIPPVIPYRVGKEYLYNSKLRKNVMKRTSSGFPVRNYMRQATAPEIENIMSGVFSAASGVVRTVGQAGRNSIQTGMRSVSASRSSLRSDSSRIVDRDRMLLSL